MYGEKILDKKDFKILITGAKGFVGKNLYYHLNENGYTNIFRTDIDTSEGELKNFVLNCDLIYNLAGVNRPKDQNEFINNSTYLDNIINILIENNKSTPIMLSSSIQSDLDNPYGRSKKEAENILIDYSEKQNAYCFIYKFPNIFGKWSKPNYNSAVATFCYNISRNLDIVINDKNAKLSLVYIDDVVNELLKIADNFVIKSNDKYSIGKYYYNVDCVYNTTVGYIADKIYSFRNSRTDYFIPNMEPESLDKKLYSTYLSFLDVNNFKYQLDMHNDDRGSFTEILKTINFGQFSVNIIKPGITKGNHYHHSKNEKFLVVSGKVLIRFRKIDSDDIIDYEVSDEKLEVVDIPPGYTHNIKNIGDTDAAVFMWANEMLDKNKQDTYCLNV